MAKVKKTLALEIISFKHPQTNETALVRTKSLSCRAQDHFQVSQSDVEIKKKDNQSISDRALITNIFIVQLEILSMPKRSLILSLFL